MLANEHSYIPHEMFRPLVNGWLGKIELARRGRNRWAEEAKECQAFYGEPTGFMWDSKYEGKFWSSAMEAPRFMITLAKAFELVAIFGPTLWSNVPHRTVTPKRQLMVPPGLFGGNMQDPRAQQMMQQIQQQMAQKRSVDEITSNMMEMWLNYTPLEQPGGGLETHGEMAVTEALIKGRSILWPKPYKMPGSQKTLTGCFWKTVDDLFIDPDGTSVDEASWVAVRWVQPWWVVEERFKLPKNSLKDRGTLESTHSVGGRLEDPLAGQKRAQGMTNDLIEYYEIFSKAGVGSRMCGVETAVAERLEDVVGKHAYMVISPEVPYPLNAPTEKFYAGADDLEVRAMYSWPVPTWTDDAWPFTLLDFYPVPGELWPKPPLAPGLGELKFLNVMISHLANRIWSSSRDIIAVEASMFEEAREILENGGDQAILKYNKMGSGQIRENIDFLQQPQTNFDVWQIIAAISDIFDKRVGLTDLLYGMNPGGTQPRTAEEMVTKQRNVSVRPEKMASVVERFSGLTARREAFCTRFFVDGASVEPLFGPFGRQAWEENIMATDVELVVREMTYSIAAGSTRRPNKDRDVANINSFGQQFGQALSQYALQTGQVQTLNGLMRKWGEASDMDVEELMLQPPPQPDPQQMMEMQRQQMQQQMQMQQQQMQFQQSLKKAEMEAGVQRKQAETQAKMQLERLKNVDAMQMDQSEHSQEMTQDQQQHRLDMTQAEQEHTLKMSMERGMNRIKQMEAITRAKAAKQPSSNGASK